MEFDNEVEQFADADESDTAGDDEEGGEEGDGDEDGPRPAKVAAVDDDDDPDPDEVEADLDAILKERIAAGDDEDEDEEDAAAKGSQTARGSVEERQETELHCPHCFLLVQATAIAETGECGHCGGPIS